MIEENVLIELMESIKNGNIWTITGVIILLLVPLVRNAVLPELEETTNQIVSSLSAALGGIAVLLVAGQPWWAAVILGLFAAPTSSGLVPLVRSFVRWILKKKYAPISVFLLLFCGCAGWQKQPCKIEKQLVDTVGIGLTATQAAIGDGGGEQYDAAMKAALGVQMLGRHAVRACELARDSAAWQQWVMLAIEAVGAVVGIIEGASEEINVPAPSALHNAMERLRNESNEIVILAQ